MAYFYIKALHIIFIVTWFAGLFYMVRLFVYSAEANNKSEPERSILLKQFALMQKRLWYGITWPSAILTLIFGTWIGILYGSLPSWLLVKLFFVLGLFIYHLSLQSIFNQQKKENFKWTSQRLRMWNEVATLFLIAIIMLAVVKELLSVVWGIVVLIAFTFLLLLAIKIYKKYRKD
ncbi:protoporphyrinogen IX oxidase [Ginsengibacter hankyongi]|uniref:Protoporphyrinogen IX oxidase n=1 Tax=Ginsengibacter hankyongi TaxID=2607284 RepID=A0A5J5IGP5_9BACT|nr:CopD family protein [Ginsengibacter hankyongi]KAA9039345.1 protoporphyrinogen IX oxidase [Ginsengibacter hankyongi]